ncbi:MAG: serine protease [Chloroflexi bacterium]|nr:serine protease [Chloroflexota bacterium]
MKRSTVALAWVPPTPPSDPKRAPFFIIGSGFCISPDGIIVTCEHVVSAFMQRDVRELIAEVPPEDQQAPLWPLRDLKMLIPHALFFIFDHSPDEMQVAAASVQNGVAKVDYDIGLLKLRPHAAFPDGYPYLEIENFKEIYEGMEVAICGFPISEELRSQLGTQTSSFTKGILSSLIPAPNADSHLVTGFQLDITATNGNSGGPVFNWNSGRVIGVLQSGPVRNQQAVPGLARAESIYCMLNDGMLDRFKHEPPIPPWA